MDANWFTASNWSQNQAPLSDSGTVLHFGGNPAQRNPNNTQRGFIFGRIIFDIGGGNYVVGGQDLAIASTGTTISHQSASNVRVDNSLVSNGGSLTLDVTGTGSLALGGSFIGSIIGFTLNKTGTGTAILGDALSANTTNVFLPSYATVNVTAGTLLGSAANKATLYNPSNGAILNVSGGATFDGGRADVYIGGLSGGGTVKGGSASGGSLTIGTDNQSGTAPSQSFSGTLTDGTGGRLNLIKYGSFEQTLSGTNTSTGTTTVNGGTLILSGTTSTLGAGAVTLNGTSTTLLFNRSNFYAVPNAIGGTGIIEQGGSGTLVLSASNTYSGGTLLNNGSLGVGNDAALGTGSITPTNGSLFAAGAARTLANNVNLANTFNTFRIGADPAGVNNLTVNGAVTGAGGMIVNAPGGQVILGGSTANTFTGLTSVTAGTLLLNKDGSVVPALGGALSIGSAVSPGAPGSATVRLNSGFQTSTGTNLNVYADGLFDVNSYSTNVGTLAMTGGEVRIGAGSLGLNALMATNASAGGSRITSTDFKNDLSLTGGTRTFTVADGSATYDLDVQAGINVGTLVKAGAGTLRLAGTTNNNLSVTLGAGTLALATDGALGTSGGTFTLAGGKVVADGGERTLSNPVNVTGSSEFGSSVAGTPHALTFTGAIALGTGSVLTVSNNAATTLNGAVSGGGNLTMSGAGTLTLSGNNTYTGKTTIDAGTLQVGSGGTSGSLGTNTGTITDNGLLAFNRSDNVTLANAISGTGGFAKLGGGTLTLTGASTYTGTTTVSAGTLVVSADTMSNAQTLVANGATLVFSGATVNPRSSSLTAQAGGTIRFINGTQLVDGDLDGLGRYQIGMGGAKFTGTTIENRATVDVASGPATFNSVTSGGTVNVAAGQTLAWNGGSNALGTLTVDGTLSTANWTSTGVITIDNGGKLVNVGGLVLSSNSRMTTNTGGTFSLTNGALDLNGALLVNNGTQTGTLNVNNGGQARGSGFFGNVTVGAGGEFGNNAAGGGGNLAAFNAAGPLFSSSAAPASAHVPAPFVGPQPSTTPQVVNVANLTLGPGSTYNFNLQNTQLPAGQGYDLTNVGNQLTLTGGVTPGDQIILRLIGLDQNGNQGTVSSFDGTRPYRFTLVQTGGGIVGYTAGEFVVNTASFANGTQGGTFSVVQQGNNLVLVFLPVPEPGTWAALILGLGVLALSLHRRGRAS